jgi:hypothetical protein
MPKTFGVKMIAALKPFTYKSPEKEIFIVFGILGATVGVGISVLGLLVPNGTHGVENWKFLIPFGVVLSVFGIGTSFLIRLFVVPSSLAAAAYGIWLIAGSAFEVPFPWILINVLFGLAGILPALILLRSAVRLIKTGPNKAAHRTGYRPSDGL